MATAGIGDPVLLKPGKSLSSLQSRDQTWQVWGSVNMNSTKLRLWPFPGVVLSSPARFNLTTVCSGVCATVLVWRLEDNFNCWPNSDMLGQSLQRLRKVLVLCGLAIAYPQFTPRGVILLVPLPSASASILRSTAQPCSYFPRSESPETSQYSLPGSGSTR